jgi:serine phosphatase RsbU (regulator of sigma subunit)
LNHPIASCSTPDGVTETENAAGEAFDDRQLEQVVRDNRLQPASELSRQVLSELQRWRPAAVNQQDDITLSSSMFFS